MAAEIRRAAENVLKTLGMWSLPVSPFKIAKAEGIVLSPGTYGERFDGRIEYLADIRRFVIYYKLGNRSKGRIHFTLGHELGHYYLEEHQEFVIHGQCHNSASDYQSELQREKEADEFSANLLMPEELFRAEVKNFRLNVCTLRDLITLADRLETSVTSTARRYCDLNVEPALLVISRNGIVEWSHAAEDLKPSGCWYVPWGSAVPEKSQTAKVGSSDQIIGHRVDPHVWFDWPKHQWIHEECVNLGDRIATWIVLDE